MDKRLSRGGFAGLLLTTLGGVAHAQAVPDPGQTSVVDEVVVTARRREERLRDVPVSVTAISEATRETLVLDRAEDYLRQVPSATLVTSGPDYMNDITIRGQGGGRLGSSETATGLFRDGVYAAGGGFGGRTLSRMDLFDISRVEVLRGPQGALFGRNSVGGAINVIANPVMAEAGWSVTTRYADPGRTDLEAVANLPLTADFGVRLGAIITEQDDGFITDLASGEALDTMSYQGVRATLDGQVSPGLRLGAIVEYSENEAPTFSGLGQRPTRIDGSVLDPSSHERTDVNRFGLATIEEFAVIGRADLETSFGDLALRVSHIDRAGLRENEDGDHFNGLSSIDVAPGPAVQYIDTAGFSEEGYDLNSVQAYLTSPSGGRLTWLIGAEYIESNTDVVTDPRFCPGYTGSAQPVIAGCAIGASGSFGAGPGAATSTTARTTSRLGVNYDAFTEDLVSLSAFGSLEYRVNDRLTLGAELRVQEDQKNFTLERYSKDPLVYFGTGPIPAGLMAPISIDPDGSGPLTASPVQFCPPGLAAGQCAAGLQTAQLEAGRSWTVWTPALTARVTLSPEHSAYLRFATGFRPGGFNTNLAPTTVRAQLESSLLYDPETAYSYEAGWKGSLFGGWLTGEAAAYYVWTNEVQAVSAPSATSRGFVLQNAGDAYVYGFEAEVRHVRAIGPGRLSASLGYSAQAGEYEEGARVLSDLDGDGLPEDVDLEGKSVPRLRDYQVTANIAWRQTLWADVSGFISVSGQFAGGGFQNPPNTQIYPDYELWDARVGISNDNWRLSAFVRNLADEVYILNAVSGNNYWSEPRVVGVELKVQR